MTVPHELLLPL